MSDELVPTPQLRWVRRCALDEVFGRDVLQQWYAEDLPAYMRSQAKGEWRDVQTQPE